MGEGKAKDIDYQLRVLSNVVESSKFSIEGSTSKNEQDSVWQRNQSIKTRTEYIVKTYIHDERIYGMEVSDSIEAWRSPLPLVLLFFACQLKGHSCTLIMIVPQPYHENFATTFFRSKKKGDGAPPGFFRAGGAASRHFATPNQTPWRRPWFYQPFSYTIWLYGWLLSADPVMFACLVKCYF